MTSILVYCLCVYFFFHLSCCAEILDKPRAWFLATYPKWLTYPTQCAFCGTFWVTLVAWLMGHVPFVYLFVAPVINYLINLYVAQHSGGRLVSYTVTSRAGDLSTTKTISY